MTGELLRTPVDLKAQITEPFSNDLLKIAHNRLLIWAGRSPAHRKTGGVAGCLMLFDGIAWRSIHLGASPETTSVNALVKNCPLIALATAGAQTRSARSPTGRWP